MCQRRKTSSRRGARDGGFGNVDAAEVKIRVDSFLGSLLCVSFRANAPPRAGPNRGSRPVRVAGVSATPDIAVSTHLFLPARERVVRSRRGALEPRPRGGVERVGAHFRGVVTPARPGSRLTPELGGAIRRAARNTECLRGARGASRSDSRSETPTRGGECGARGERRLRSTIGSKAVKLARKDARVAGRPTTVSVDAAIRFAASFFDFFRLVARQEAPPRKHARSKSRPQILDRFNAVAVSADRPPLAGGHCGDARGGSAKSLPGPRAVRGVTSARDRRRVGSNARGRAGGDGRPRASVGEKLLHRCRDGPQGRPSCTRVTP